MVFVVWETYGICKWAMLNRCNAGTECPWRHPEKKERVQLWDLESKKQKKDWEEHGIPPPVNTHRNARDRPPPGVNGRDADPPPAGANVTVPTTLPPAPASLPARPQDREISRSNAQEPRAPTPTIDSSSRLVFVDLYVKPDTEPGEIEEVSMLDAPPSPTAAAASFMPKKGANKEPLGRPNRLASKDEDTIMTASADVGPQQPHASQGDDKKSARKSTNQMPLGRPNRLASSTGDTVMTAGVHVGPAQPRIVQEDSGKSAQNSTSQLSLVAPTANAISVWMRPQTPVPSQTTDNSDSPARSGGYGEMPPPAGVPRLDPTLIQAASATPEDSTFKTPYGVPYKQPTMGAMKRTSNGEAKPIGPHPSTIRVSARYMSQAAVEKRLQQPAQNGELDHQERSVAEAREDSMRLQGVTWIDNVRRSLQLPIRTYSTACMYYHKFRLAHPGVLNTMEYGNAWADACAASLLTAGKVEDTLKKSKDILAAAYNLKVSTHDQLGSDDAGFEAPSRAVIGLERMVLEAGGFDFRSKNPHKLFYKIAHSMPEGEDDERAKVEKVGFTVMTDLFRTFAPLKHTNATMALAGLELAAHLVATSSPDNVSAIRDKLRQYDINKWSTTREEVMETLLDLLDLYTQHTANTILGTQYSLDDFLRVRLAFNKECNDSNIARNTTAPAPDRGTNGTTLQVANGHPTPVSPPAPDSQTQPQPQNQPPVPEGGGTLRFMLNPQLAADEKTEVQKYFVEEWEEYEEEIEVPIPRRQSDDRGSRRGSAPNIARSDRELSRGTEDRDRERERLREREREIERDRIRMRERERERDRRFAGSRYDDRRYDDRRDRRFDDRRFDEGRRRGR